MGIRFSDFLARFDTMTSNRSATHRALFGVDLDLQIGLYEFDGDPVRSAAFCLSLAAPQARVGLASGEAPFARRQAS